MWVVHLPPGAIRELTSAVSVPSGSWRLTSWSVTARYHGCLRGLARNGCSAVSGPSALYRNLSKARTCSRSMLRTSDAKVYPFYICPSSPVPADLYLIYPPIFWWTQMILITSITFSLPPSLHSYQRSSMISDSYWLSSKSFFLPADFILAALLSQLVDC